MPATGLLFASVTVTVIGLASCTPAAPVCVSPDVSARFAAAPAVAVALKVTGEPVRPEAVAVTVCVAPAVVPKVHVDVATPEASVVAVVVPSEPPPAVTAKVTL